ncbi:hypothetical protein BGX38DRAFT_1154482 [Terfezia claveryi]|nr:hypothetical protein BGX38DRAFT_1154482 [Terfezia claveryi]
MGGASSSFCPPCNISKDSRIALRCHKAPYCPRTNSYTLTGHTSKCKPYNSQPLGDHL